VNARGDSMMTNNLDNNNPNNKNYSLALIRRFDFSSKLQRMSVIVKNFLDNGLRAYVKGSPERIKDLCLDETIPDNFDEVL
jgi:cation-transporting P-type ATPase 13A2